MNPPVATLRLQDAWRECKRNAYHVQSAYQQLVPLLPMTGSQFEQLSDDKIRTLDQFVLRFTKLQDAMGSRLFPAILAYLQEPYETQPMLDKLNRLEKLVVRFTNTVTKEMGGFFRQARRDEAP